MRRIIATLLGVTVVGFVTADPIRVAAAADPVRVAGTNVQFTVTKLGFADVVGHFREFNADIRYDALHPEQSSVRWRVRVASVETGEPNRDQTLQGPDYFAAAQHPELTFESRTVRADGNRRLSVTGDISIRGITKSVTVPVTITEQNGRRTFVTDFEVDRYDFDVRGGSVASRLIGRTVRVHLAGTEGAAQ
jgi:polyisoprenoid-binding protein YceI